MSIRVLIAGKHGQLAWELARTVPSDLNVIWLSSLEMDISQANEVKKQVQAHRPHVVVNAAAYTQVDKAETEQAQAFSVNANGVLHLAQACNEVNARLIHISTDFVFDGAKSSPYLPSDSPNPLGVYGKSKLEGERLAQEVMPCNNLLILRTSWLYSSHGRNFVKTILRLASANGPLRVVCDQVGSPTWAYDLAQAVWHAVLRPEVHGVHHFSNAGVASWYDMAVAVVEEAVRLGLLVEEREVVPIPNHAYPTPAKRPHYSVLNFLETWNCLGIAPVHWRKRLFNMLTEFQGSMS